MASLDNTAANIREVRNTFKFDKVEFVLLPDIDQAGSAIARKIKEHEEKIDELREAIRGNPMFYHAADSHSVLIGDIIALEFDDENGVKIYAAGEGTHQVPDCASAIPQRRHDPAIAAHSPTRSADYPPRTQLCVS